MGLLFFVGSWQLDLKSENAASFFFLSYFTDFLIHRKVKLRDIF